MRNDVNLNHDAETHGEVFQHSPEEIQKIVQPFMDMEAADEYLIYEGIWNDHTIPDSLALAAIVFVAQNVAEDGSEGE